MTQRVCFLKVSIYFCIFFVTLCNGQAQLVIPDEVPTPKKNSYIYPPAENNSSSYNGHKKTPGGIVSANILNLRMTPSLTADVVDTLVEGNDVEVLRSQDKWLMIRTANQKQGWVHGDYVLTGEKYLHARALMDKKWDSLQGTWRGVWEKHKDEEAESVLHIVVNNENKIYAALTVDKWSCWEIFEGYRSNDHFFLTGIGVFKNRKNAAQYVLDKITLRISKCGLRMEGAWSDPEGSSGEVEYRFFELQGGHDKDIWDVLKEKVK